ncbi:MAG: ABC transporter substrate-binding protein [Candidatus Hermodarchaeota archaeon]
MKCRRLIIIFLIVLLSLQFAPVNLVTEQSIERDSELANSQGIESTSNLVPPSVLKYIVSPGDFGIEYDMIQRYSIIATIIFDPLVEYSFDTEGLMPGLAKQWVVTNDSKHWIFTLRDDVTFHDGSKFNASSVKFTYDRFIDPAHPAYVADPIAEFKQMPLESVEILDEFKVSINFYQPYAPFIYQEAPYCGIYSPNSFEGGSNIIKPIGTGPYYLDESASNATFQKFIRNDNHFRGVPPFEEIQLIKYNSWQDFEIALHAHEGSLATRGMNLLSENDTYWEKSLGTNVIRFGVFNHLRPIIDDSNVRLAINYAVNKDLRVNQVNGEEEVEVKSLRSVIFSGDPYHDESIQGYPYNIELANSILDNAGYAPLSDGYRFDIDLVGINFDELALIKEELEAISIRCNIISGNYSELFNNYLYSGNFDLFILGWTPILDPSLSRMLLHSSGVLNYGSYSNSEIDLYTDLGQQTPVRQEREYYYSQVQQIAQEDAPLLLLYEKKGTYLKATNVTSFIQFSKDGRLIFNYSTETEDSDIYNMEEIEIASESIYFPFTDGVFTLEDQQIEGNMTMTHELNNLMLDQQERGKFYEIQVNDSELEYQLKCYYDLDEISPSSQHKVQEVFQWNFSSKSWDKLEIIKSNINLRFSEIRLKGNAVLRIGIEDIIELTFRYLSIILIIVIPIVSLSGVVIMKNRKIMKKVKEEYGL